MKQIKANAASEPPLDCRVGRQCIQRIKHPDIFNGGKWTYTTEDRDVVLMALSGTYAMVRRKGCMPYVCDVKELSPAPVMRTPNG